MRACLDSPSGPPTLLEGDGQITALRWDGTPGPAPIPPPERAAGQLGEHFAGIRTAFVLPLRPGAGFACGADPLPMLVPAS